MSKKIDKESLGYRLSKICFELGLSKKEFGLKLNVVGSSVGRYFDNSREPQYSFLHLLCTELNVNPEYIFGMSEIMFKELKEEK